MDQSTTTAQPSVITSGVILAPGEVAIREYPLPELKPGEALVRQRATAICSWEYRSYMGLQKNRFPFLGGHETAGDIIAINPPAGDLAVGDRVAIGPTPCGQCHWCRSGLDRVCAHSAPLVTYPDPQNEDAWGPAGFGDYRVHPISALYNIGSADYETGALTEPLACALHGSKLLHVGVGEDVVVIGAGVMGLMNVIAARQHGARVIVSEVDAGRLAKAREFGATDTVDASATDPVQAVKDLTDGRGAAVVIIAIGNEKAVAQGYDMLASRGRMLLFASSHPDIPLSLSSNDIHGREVAVLGTKRLEKSDFYAASQLIRYGVVDLSPLIAQRFPVSQLKAALDAASVPHTYRSIVNL